MWEVDNLTLTLTHNSSTIRDPDWPLSTQVYFINIKSNSELKCNAGGRRYLGMDYEIVVQKV